MPVRALRGATTVTADTAEDILTGTREMLEALISTNALTSDDIISAIFTTTPDLTADFPAHEARRLGWHAVPLLGAVEMAVPGGLPRCIRVLMHVETDRNPETLRHGYLREAAALRPDWSGAERPSARR